MFSFCCWQMTEIETQIHSRECRGEEQLLCSSMGMFCPLQGFGLHTALPFAPGFSLGSWDGEILALGKLESGLLTAPYNQDQLGAGS